MEFSGKKIETDDFFYDVVENNRYDLRKILLSKDDYNKVQDAIDLILEFKREAEEKGIIIYH